jgi:iron complex outermembrane receptor protein
MLQGFSNHECRESRPPRVGPCHVFASTAVVLVAAGACLAQNEETLTPETVADLSMEELMSLAVTSVAGVNQEWFSTPAAVYRISGTDVRRGGFRTLADAMRLAPGVFVGQSGSSSYSVGMRGFNGSLANKTLVLIDGRAVYDPLYGGTFWDVQDILLEDLDRIEIVRGPGATLWGANAVNGVINVTTKSASETQGVLLAGGLGTYEQAFGEGRYGFRLGEQTWARVYGKWFERDELVTSSGDSAHDDWAMERGGFRLDHGKPGELTFTLQGDIYNTDRFGEFNPAAPVPGENVVFVRDIRDTRRSGGNLLARLAKETADSGWSLQGYYDRTFRRTNVTFEVERDTFATDWRHHFRPDTRHEIVWGLNARFTQDRTEDGANLLLRPENGDFSIFGGFLQDTITIVPDRVFAMIGSKLSYDDYTGAQFQPGARLWWTPNDRHTLWASLSRPVRIPSRTEHEGMLAFGYIDTGTLAGMAPTGTIIPLGIQPNDDLKAEELIAYEAGYRVRALDALTFDAALFYNDYENLIYVNSVIEPFNNDGFGETYGGELAVAWNASDAWTVRASYSYSEVLIHGPVIPADEGNTPLHQVKVNSNIDITKHLELNAGMYYVDDVPQQGTGSYVRLDVGVTWRPTPNVEFAVWGQNLLEPRHSEYGGNEVERGVYLMATLRF